MIAATVAMVRVSLDDRDRPVPATFSPRVLLAGLAVGVLTGFFGVGGGFLIVPALMLVLGLPMRAAVGTSLLVIAIKSAAALAGHFRYGGIDIEVTTPFIVSGTLGVLLGSRFSPRIDEARRETASQG